MTNLAELLEVQHDGVVPTLRDGELSKEADELKAKYLTKYTTAIEAAKVRNLQSWSFFGCRIKNLLNYPVMVCAA